MMKKMGLRRRQMSMRVKSAMGLVKTKDEELVESRKVLSAMVKDLELVGSGVSEHVLMLRNYYENGDKLSCVVSEFFYGEKDKSKEWEEANGKPYAVDEGLAEAARVSTERWQYLNAVARRSAAKIIVEEALNPLRNLSDEISSRIRKELDAHDLAKADLLYKRGKKKFTSQQIAQAEALNDSTRQTALDSIEAALRKFDECVTNAVCVLAGCHVELFAASAEYLEEAFEHLPSTKFRDQMREMVKVGGPALARKKRSGARRAFELLSGKSKMDDFKKEEEDAERRLRLQEEQFKRAIQEEEVETSRDEPESKSTFAAEASRLVEERARLAQYAVVRAIFDCVGEEEGELSFRKGELIEIMDDSTADSGWCEGRLLGSGQVGLFPSNYVVKQKVALALFDCESDTPEDLAFTKGDKLFILQEDSPDWWQAEKDDGSIGLVPTNYLRPL